MDRTKLFRPVVYLALFMVGLYLLTEKFYWYYSIWWFDMPVHFLGGFWEGIFFLWYFSEVRLPFLRRPILKLDIQTALQALLFVFFIGISWEAGEFLTFNYIGLEPWSYLDSRSDIFFDIAGGIAALLYSFFKTRPLPLNNVQSS